MRAGRPARTSVPGRVAATARNTPKATTRTRSSRSRPGLPTPGPLPDQFDLSSARFPRLWPSAGALCRVAQTPAGALCPRGGAGSGHSVAFARAFFPALCGARDHAPHERDALRGATPQYDVALREAMLASKALRRERDDQHLLRNDLGRLAAPGDVRVDALRAAEAYPTLWQQVPTVSAALPHASSWPISSSPCSCVA